MALVRAYWQRMKVPGENPPVLKWGARVYLYSRIGRDQIVDAAQRNSQIPKAYLQQTYDALITEIENFVMNGHSITLNRFGTIRSFFRGAGSTSQANYDISLLKQVKFSFKPSVELNRMLKQTSISVAGIGRPFTNPNS